jgi:hypothetical protein
MYHGAHGCCEPARAERINVEDPASPEEKRRFREYRVLRVTRILHAYRPKL